MRPNRTPDEWNKWCLARERIDEELKEYYRACATGELPPQLHGLSKKLDEELLKKAGPIISGLAPTPLPAALVWQRDVNTFGLILHPTCIIKPVATARCVWSSHEMLAKGIEG